MRTLSINPLNQLQICNQFRAKTTTKITARSGNSSSDDQQQLNLSVLRFTFGIPGLDESYLPRWIGYGFGSLLLLNHFAGSGSATTPAQLRTEALGLSLAAFSIALPYLGRFLKGANLVEQKSVPQDTEQIFVMSENVSDNQKEDLAWASYVLLRNTNSFAVLISVRGKLCVRGFWNVPNVSKADLLRWFEKRMEDIGLSDLKEELYFPQTAGTAWHGLGIEFRDNDRASETITDFGLWEILTRGTQSVLVEPMLQATDLIANVEKIEGFIILASSLGYAYNDKDRAWIKAIANKFRGNDVCLKL